MDNTFEGQNFYAYYPDENYFLKKLVKKAKTGASKLGGHLKDAGKAINKASEKLVRNTLGDKVADQAAKGGLHGIAAGLKVAAPIGVAIGTGGTALGAAKGTGTALTKVATVGNTVKQVKDITSNIKTGNTKGVLIDTVKNVGSSQGTKNIISNISKQPTIQNTLGKINAAKNVVDSVKNIAGGIQPEVKKEISAISKTLGVLPNLGDYIKNNQISPELLPKTRNKKIVERDLISDSAINSDGLIVNRKNKQLTASGTAIDLNDPKVIIMALAVLIMFFFLFIKKK